MLRSVPGTQLTPANSVVSLFLGLTRKVICSDCRKFRKYVKVEKSLKSYSLYHSTVTNI